MYPMYPQNQPPKKPGLISRIFGKKEPKQEEYPPFESYIPIYAPMPLQPIQQPQTPLLITQYPFQISPVELPQEELSAINTYGIGDVFPGMSVPPTIQNEARANWDYDIQTTIQYGMEEAALTSLHHAITETAYLAYFQGQGCSFYEAKQKLQQLFKDKNNS